MTARELQIRLQAAQPPTLLHVLPPEVLAATRIPGSLNACVYEMTIRPPFLPLTLAHALARFQRERNQTKSESKSKT